jgi:hypothetical protein
MENKYNRHILETIRKTKENRDWTVSDYVKPLKTLYKSLNPKDKIKFNSSLIILLHDKRYIANLVDICRELKIQESCSELLRLLVNTPVDMAENGYPVWIEGLQRNIIYTLGALKCRNAVNVLEKLVNDKVMGEETSLSSLTLESYGIIIKALTDISLKESSKYFGWWITKSQEIDDKQIASLGQLDDWKIMKNLNIAPNIEDSTYGADSVRQCLISVAQKSGLTGLKKWLSSITLYSNEDRHFLHKQIFILADDSNSLFPNLKMTCNYRGKSVLLAKELSDLPRIRERLR